MRSILATLILGSLALSFSAGCARHGSAGDSCQGPGLPSGEFEQCAPGFVCTPDPSGVGGNGQSAHWDEATCRPTCSSNFDCTAEHTSCRAVAGSDYLMACQPD